MRLMGWTIAFCTLEPPRPAILCLLKGGEGGKKNRMKMIHNEFFRRARFSLSSRVCFNGEGCTKKKKKRRRKNGNVENNGGQ